MRSASGSDMGDGDGYGSRFLLAIVELRETVGRDMEAEDSCTEALLFYSLSLLTPRCLVKSSPSY